MSNELSPEGVKQIDLLGLALDLEAQAKRVESQTAERAMFAAAWALRCFGAAALRATPEPASQEAAAEPVAWQHRQLINSEWTPWEFAKGSVLEAMQDWMKEEPARVQLRALYAAPQAPQPSQEAKDAARYRWLRQYEVDSYLVGGSLNELDAAIDRASTQPGEGA